MKMLSFGGRGGPLFGAYHGPTRAATTSRAVLLCYPIGHEYFKAHRACRLLAGQLARSGAHVWRFDYFGTGDSAGRGDEGDIVRWVANIELAIRELKAASLLSHVSLVGLRFGASLAAIAAAKDPSVEHLVLWDPILDGSSYVDELMAVAVDENGNRSPPGDTDLVSVVGCPFNTRLREQIRAVDLTQSLDAYSGEVLAVVSTEDEGSEVDRLRVNSAGKSRLAAHKLILGSPEWGALNQEPLVPQQAIRWITARLTGPLTLD